MEQKQDEKIKCSILKNALFWQKYGTPLRTDWPIDLVNATLLKLIKIYISWYGIHINRQMKILNDDFFFLSLYILGKLSPKPIDLQICCAGDACMWKVQLGA